ncbi:MAG TPA: TIGR03118 family protein [Gallionella sp.]|nr:TIGR03118 family protein [Gallionella sp.]
MKALRKFAALSAFLLLAFSVYADGGANAYNQHNLVSDGFVAADHTDPKLINAWGIAATSTSPMWVADNGTGFSTIYDGLGNPQPLVVTIPGGSPTGLIANDTADFAVSRGTVSGAPTFIFATENGSIAGWSRAVDLNNAVTMVDRSGVMAVYKGIAMAANGTDHFLYATDFHNARIDVFDKAYKPVTLPAGAFTDSQIPVGFAPFGIRNINGDLYVTYAMQDAAKHDDVAGPGLGFVDVFDANGRLLRRLAARGTLNAPWGLALAPSDFGEFSNCLLVANFGDGKINAYELESGEFRGQLNQPNAQPVVIDGLWGINFGNGLHNQPTNVLFFGAGPGAESHGLYGRLEAAQKRVP